MTLSQASLFLQLPLEIRIHIYEFAHIYNATFHLSSLPPPSQICLHQLPGELPADSDPLGRQGGQYTMLSPGYIDLPHLKTTRHAVCKCSPTSARTSSKRTHWSFRDGLDTHPECFSIIGKCLAVSTYPTDGQTIKSSALKLMLTCKFLHREISSFLYKNNFFSFFIVNEKVHLSIFSNVESRFPLQNLTKVELKWFVATKIDFQESAPVGWGMFQPHNRRVGRSNLERRSHYYLPFKSYRQVWSHLASMKSLRILSLEMSVSALTSLARPPVPNYVLDEWINPIQQMRALELTQFQIIIGWSYFKIFQYDTDPCYQMSFASDLAARNIPSSEWDDPKLPPEWPMLPTEDLSLWDKKCLPFV